MAAAPSRLSPHRSSTHTSMQSIHESDEEGVSPPFALRHALPPTGSESSHQLSPPHQPSSLATSDAGSDHYDSEPESSPRVEGA